MNRPHSHPDPRHEMTPVSDIPLVQNVAVNARDYPFLSPPADAGEIGWFHQYRVLRKLGQGGMGVVFLAEDMVLQRPVALKVMHPPLASHGRSRRRFLREARAMAAVRSEYIVTIYEVGSADAASAVGPDVPYLAMECLEGETLQARLLRERRLPPREGARIGREIAEGLAAAHGKGLIHRDIKPSNIWLTAPHGRVKILDFGLVHMIEGDPALSTSGQIIGTPCFMSPEQARGEAVDPRSDLFSLGSLLYLALSGEAPFSGSNPVSLVRKVTTQEPAPLFLRLPAVPPELAELVRRLLAKDRADRPVSAAEVAAALATIEANCPQVIHRAGEAVPGQAPSSADTVTSAFAQTSKIILLTRELRHPSGHTNRLTRRRMLIAAAAALGAVAGLAAYSLVRRLAP
jgi:serine/threonine protein kinase